MRNENPKKSKTIPFPVLLDDFGAQLAATAKELEKEVLKPALMSDILKLINGLFQVQQLMVHMYTLNANNHVELAKRVEEAVTGWEDLKTKVAGYSERLNGFEKKLEEAKKHMIQVIIEELKTNVELRKAFKEAIQ